MESSNMSRLDLPSIQVESPSPWGTMVVVVAIATVIIHFGLLRYVVDIWRETVWNPWKVSKRLRQQGFPGPSLSFFKNQKKEMQQLASTIPWEPLMTNKCLNHDIEPRIFPHLHTWRNLYGDKFIFKRGSKVHLHTSDPEVIKVVLATKFADYGKCAAVAVAFDLLGHNSIVFAEKEEWTRQRQVVRPAFYPGRTKNLVIQIASWIEIWLQRLDNLVIENGGSVEINMMPELFELTKDILARTSFGTSFEKGKEGFRHQDKHKELLIRQGLVGNPFYRWMPSALKKEICKEKGELLRCLREIIQDRRNSILPGNYESYGDDFLGLLLADRDRRLALEGRPPGHLETSDEQITDQCRTFFFAGDTVHSFLGWAVVFLGFYTDWQERIRTEVRETFEGATPDGDKVVKLKQVTMFVEETLRLYGPIVMTTREVFNDNTTINGEPMPKHLAVMINFCALQRRKECWGDDAMEFKPERFSEGIAKASEKPNSYTPFGWGPRTCIAQQFAMTEVKLILSMLVQRFSIRMSPAYRHEPAWGMSLFPKFGAPVILEHVQHVSA